MGPSTVIPLDDALAEVPTLVLDTSPIIYLIETHPEYDVLVTDATWRVLLAGITNH